MATSMKASRWALGSRRRVLADAIQGCPVRSLVAVVWIIRRKVSFASECGVRPQPPPLGPAVVRKDVVSDGEQPGDLAPLVRVIA